MQQMQLASNLAGLTVRTPNSNVLWLVSDGGEVGRSEDGGADMEIHIARTTRSLRLRFRANRQDLLAAGRARRNLPHHRRQDVHGSSVPRRCERFEFEHIEAKDELTATVTEADGRKFSTSDGGKTWTPTK